MTSAVSVRAAAPHGVVRSQQRVCGRSLAEIRKPCQWRARSTDAEAAVKTGDEDTEDLSDKYTDVMQERMGSATLTYRHEDGTNYSRILDDLVVGSCLQTVEDVDKIYDKEDVRTVMCLQEDSDMAWFDLDIQPILARAAERDNMHHVRHRIRDFDPFSLRMELPGAVAALSQSAATSGGTAYVHCTAGLGRAPATALAYMWWFKGWHLEDAYEHLTGIRACKPNVAAIRNAAADVLYGEPPTPVNIVLPRYGIKDLPKVAGLDVGWGQQLELGPDPQFQHRYLLQRQLPPGTYQFKFVIDGRWGHAPNLPTMLDHGNLNNYVSVLYRNTDPAVQAARKRLLAPGGRLSPEEAQQIQEKLQAMAATGGGSTGNLAAAAAAK